MHPLRHAYSPHPRTWPRGTQKASRGARCSRQRAFTRPSLVPTAPKQERPRAQRSHLAHKKDSPRIYTPPATPRGTNVAQPAHQQHQHVATAVGLGDAPKQRKELFTRAAHASVVKHTHAGPAAAQSCQQRYTLGTRRILGKRGGRKGGCQTAGLKIGRGRWRKRHGEGPKPESNAQSVGRSVHRDTCYVEA